VCPSLVPRFYSTIQRFIPPLFIRVTMMLLLRTFHNVERRYDTNGTRKKPKTKRTTAHHPWTIQLNDHSSSIAPNWFFSFLCPTAAILQKKPETPKKDKKRCGASVGLIGPRPGSAFMLLTWFSGEASHTTGDWTPLGKHDHNVCCTSVHCVTRHPTFQQLWRAPLPHPIWISVEETGLGQPKVLHSKLALGALVSCVFLQKNCSCFLSHPSIVGPNTTRLCPVSGIRKKHDFVLPTS